MELFVTEIYALDSRRRYPPIVRSGSIAFTKGASNQTFNITETQTNERYMVYVEENGEIRRPAYYESQFNGVSLVYIESGILKLYMGDFDARSGRIYWRAYYDEV